MHHALNAFEFTPGPRVRLPWVAYGLWVRAVIVGLAAFATGVVLLSNGSHGPLAGIATMIGGALVATFAWRRAGAALDQLTALEPAIESPNPRAIAAFAELSGRASSLS